MNTTDIRIETAAMKMLAHWKAFFAETVMNHAEQLAAESQNPELVTARHFRRASKTAIAALAAAINDEFSDAEEKAA